MIICNFNVYTGFVDSSLRIVSETELLKDIVMCTPSGTQNLKAKQASQAWWTKDPCQG